MISVPGAALDGATASVPLQSTATLAAAAAIPALAWVTLAVWVYLDAVARESDRPVRAVLVVAAVPPLLVWYVSRRGDRARPQSDREQLALTVLLALLSAMMAGTIFAPPDVFAQPRNTFGALLITLPLFYVLIYRGNESNDREESAS